MEFEVRQRLELIERRLVAIETAVGTDSEVISIAYLIWPDLGI